MSGIFLVLLSFSLGCLAETGESEGSFHPITEFVTGTDVIPSLTPAYEMPPLAKPLLPTPPTDDVTSTGLNASQTQLPQLGAVGDGVYWVQYSEVRGSSMMSLRKRR
ncbi:unnamed protein product [Haemonchus placei]|uniref:Secreted protein n=1 Tax=Haemonchus placei TaxID=6290 RepID=A0A0N4WZH4_HAEPC|nr:unnamed protein product [Haemonchus placei]